MSANTNYNPGFDLSKYATNSRYKNMVITIYGINGQIIKQYKGRYFIFGHRNGDTVFEDVDGNRHMIYNHNGIVTVDYNEN